MRVSGGFYVRSLVRDVGVACGSVAHMTSLCRTQQGSFDLDQALPEAKWTPRPSGGQDAAHSPAIGGSAATGLAATGDSTACCCCPQLDPVTRLHRCLLFLLRLDSRSAEACDLLVRALQFFSAARWWRERSSNLARASPHVPRRRVGSLSDALGRLGLDLAALALEEMLELEPRRVRRLPRKTLSAIRRARRPDVRSYLNDPVQVG